MTRIILSIGAFVLAFGIFLGFTQNSTLAEIVIPFSNTDAGLDLVKRTDDKVVESAPDRGAEALVEIMTTAFYYMKIFLGIFAIVWIVWAGFYGVTTAGSGEKEIESAKKMVIYAILGLITMLLIEPFILDIVYGGGGNGVSYQKTSFNDLVAASKNLRIQVDGMVMFAKTILVFVAMAYVIYAGVKMMFSAGESDGVKTAKGMFLPIIFGIFIILFNEIIIDLVIYDIIFDGNKVQFSPDSQNALEFVRQLVGVLQYFLQFVGLLLFLYFLYGGFLYIASFGDSGAADKAKKIFKNAFIGMVILVLSFILMWSLLNWSIT